MEHNSDKKTAQAQGTEDSLCSSIWQPSRKDVSVQAATEVKTILLKHMYAHVCTSHKHKHSRIHLCCQGSPIFVPSLGHQNLFCLLLM